MGIINYSGIAESRIAPIFKKVIEKENHTRCLLITATYLDAKRVAGDLSFFTDKSLFVFPDDEEQWIGYEAKNRDTMVGQLAVIKEILTREELIVVAPLSAVLKKRVPKEVFLNYRIPLKVGAQMQRQDLVKKLIIMGYESVHAVYAPGQFASRGSVLDVFSPYEKNPFRLDFFDDEIETIKVFDVESQRSQRSCRHFDLFPAEGMLLNEDSIVKGMKKIKQRYDRQPERREKLLEYVSQFENLQHLEFYMDYFYPQWETLIDYMNPLAIFMNDPNRLYEKTEQIIMEQKQKMELLFSSGDLVQRDKDLLLEKKQFLNIYEQDSVYCFTPMTRRIKGVEALEELHHIEARPILSYNGKLDLLEKDLRRYLFNGYQVILVCGGAYREKNLQEFLLNREIGGTIEIQRGELSSGMDFPQDKTCYITDRDIFGGSGKKKRRKSLVPKTHGEKINIFSEIKVGDFIVHEQHGIGKFLAMEQLKVGGEKKDYLKIQYAGDDFLYVPVEQMDVIQRYIGKDVQTTALSKLNGNQWKKTKAKAKKAVAELAEELIHVSAQRSHQKGHAFGKDTPWQKEFEESFPFEETPDQLTCIGEIKADMEKEAPMDRLLCGDVGYGKTEVAARAMFKCVAEGKQVALLVPTTILAEQHYHTLKERFEKFPFTVDLISRFRTVKEQEITVRNLKSGRIDLIIGTHRLLSKDVTFKELGLLVVDEEQRFGVGDKEKIKKLKNTVDVLTLSATPIPRTLHMSLIGIRDMSVIEEPPEERYPVQTYVLEEQDHIIKEAIERELARGGQVFFVHNRINGVERVAKKIEELVPGSKIGIGHGRMGEGELEQLMMDFVEGTIEILVSTTIIESGIDIPNVNTIIVLDADRFGLSQLYQLRGRVGRSHRLAYAYFTHKSGKVLTEVAEKRLRAIREFTEFGAGFKLSLRDLEIRGAGNILGGQQHGHMMNVGYELYCKMVQEAVAALKGQPEEEKQPTAQIEVQTDAYIPESYIRDETDKLAVYKKIATIGSWEEKGEILEELEDRFGAVPWETRQLIQVAFIKFTAEQLGIIRILQNREKVTFFYEDKGEKPFLIYLSRINQVLNEVEEFLKNLWLVKQGVVQ